MQANYYIPLALSENLGLQKFLRVSYSREAIKETNLHFLSLFRRTLACQTLMSEKTKKGGGR